MRSPRPGGAVRAAAVVLVAVLALLVPGAHGAFTARVTGPSTSASTNPAFTCTAAAAGNLAGPAAHVTYPFGELSGTTATDVAGGARHGAYSASGVQYAQQGPCLRDAGTAVVLDGATGSVAGPSSTFTPGDSSQEVWFRTTVGGGMLLGFGSARTGTSSSTDRLVHLSAEGHVVLGLRTGASGATLTTVRSTATYLDGRWHHVVGTYGGTGNAHPGLRLYVDGVLVAQDPAAVATSTTARFWRAGFDSLAGWPSAPANHRFSGGLAWASLYLSTLTPAQVDVHHRAGLSSAGLRGRHSFMSVTHGATMHLRHYNFEAYVSPITTETADPVWRDDATFAVVAGLADPSCASFQSVNYPDRYLRHSGFRVYLHVRDGSAGFDSDATFCQRPGNSGRGISWASHGFPTRFLRVHGSNCGASPTTCPVWIATNGGGTTGANDPTNWASDTSWIVNAPVSP